MVVIDICIFNPYIRLYDKKQLLFYISYQIQTHILLVIASIAIQLRDRYVVLYSRLSVDTYKIIIHILFTGTSIRINPVAENLFGHFNCPTYL